MEASLDKRGIAEIFLPKRALPVFYFFNFFYNSVQVAICLQKNITFLTEKTEKGRRRMDDRQT